METILDSMQQTRDLVVLTSSIVIAVTSVMMAVLINYIQKGDK